MCPISTYMDCKQKTVQVSKKDPTVSAKASPGQRYQPGACSRCDVGCF